MVNAGFEGNASMNRVDVDGCMRNLYGRLNNLTSNASGASTRVGGADVSSLPLRTCSSRL